MNTYCVCKNTGDLHNQEYCGLVNFDFSFISSFPDPFILPHMQVDKGAIRFVLSGANIMCPGLTSPGAKMTNVPADTVVVSF